MGICNIMATKPYPRSFLVMQPMTSSCKSALTKNVNAVAPFLDKYGSEAPYTCRRRKLWTGMFHSRENSSLTASNEFL